MRVLFDSNVLIAAFLSHGACAELFEYCIETHTICIPMAAMGEFAEKLSGKLKFSKKTVIAAVSYLKANSELLDSEPLSVPVCRDPEDDAILGAAIRGNVDCIITGDDDLLTLKKFRETPILKPADFWRFEKEHGRG